MGCEVGLVRPVVLTVTWLVDGERANFHRRQNRQRTALRRSPKRVTGDYVGDHIHMHICGAYLSTRASVKMGEIFEI